MTLLSHRAERENGPSNANLLEILGWQIRVCQTLREGGTAIMIAVELRIGFECI